MAGPPKQAAAPSLGIELRPEVLARIELLRIVWRPDRDAATAIKAAAELEQYAIAGKAAEKSADPG